MTLNPLANPKGVKPVCELCQKPAFVQCTSCRVAYYCGAEHQHIDWCGIHEKICQLLIPLRSPIPIISGSEEERDHRKLQQKIRQKQLIELTRTMGQKLLFEGKYEFAIPAAMQSLKLSIEVYGLASIELVPSYLILAEACIGLGRSSQAEEYLSQAQWTVIKIPSCDNEVKSRLHRNLGMMYATQENYAESLRHFADDIYNSSLAFGTDHIKTAGGYFHMANVFFQQKKPDPAFSLYAQVTSIWSDHLSRLVEQRMRKPTTTTATSKPVFTEENVAFEVLDEAQAAEAFLVLGAILQRREQQTTQVPAVLCSLYCALSKLHVVRGDFIKAREFAEKALGMKTSLANAGEQDCNTERVQKLLAAITRLQDDK